MRLSLQPYGKVAYGHTAKKFVVALPNGEKAVLEEMKLGTWRLTIDHPNGRVDRGVFGSTHDILTLLEAEYFPVP